MATEASVDIVVVQVGILDWEMCAERFNQRPGSDVYFDKKFPARAIWYMAQGMYKMYYVPVVADDSQIVLCDKAYYAQGNNPYANKAVYNERTMSMGDIVLLSNETVWLCIGSGWQCLNPGVI
jgi:hypothetical protein